MKRTTHPNPHSLVGTIVSDGHRWVLVESLDTLDKGDDDPRTGEPICCGPAVDEFYYNRDGSTEVYESSVYMDFATQSVPPVDVRRALEWFAAAKAAR